MGPALGVVVLARPGSSFPSVERHLEALLGYDPRPDIVVVAAASSPAASVAAPLGLRLLPTGDSMADAADRAVRAVKGDVIAFVDAGAHMAPSWPDAMLAPIADGAGLVAGPVANPLLGPAGTTLRGNGFLPAARVWNMAVSRDVYCRLGGFEPRLPHHFDADLAFRAQLTGFRLAFDADAWVDPGRPGLASRLARDWREATDLAPLEWRYQRHAYARGYSWAELHPPGNGASGWEHWAGRMRRGARRAGWVTGRARLIAGAQPPPILEPAGLEEVLTAQPLPEGPDFLVVGLPADAHHRWRSSLATGAATALAPSSLAAEAARAWDQPAPWSLAMVRAARRGGWDLPVHLAAWRLEGAGPRTHGQAWLTLHRVNAWLAGWPSFALSVPAGDGPPITDRLPDVPVVLVGADPGLPHPPAVVLSGAGAGATGEPCAALDAVLHHRAGVRRR